MSKFYLIRLSPTHRLLVGNECDHPVVTIRVRLLNCMDMAQASPPDGIANWAGESSFCTLLDGKPVGGRLLAAILFGISTPGLPTNYWQQYARSSSESWGDM